MSKLNPCMHYAINWCKREYAWQLDKARIILQILNIMKYASGIYCLTLPQLPLPPFPFPFIQIFFSSPIVIENRVYRVEFTGKKCKTAILLYCFHTAGVFHIFMLYNLLGPGISFYRESKIIWPIIISYRLYDFHFTNEDFPL